MMPTSASPVAQRPQPVAPVPQQPAPVVASAPQVQSPSYSSGYNQQPAYSQPPPPPSAGYDYDPYAVREEEPRNTTRWIIIGCVGVSVFCCCATIGGLFLVDALCLWDRIPIVGDLIRAIGWSVNCAV